MCRIGVFFTVVFVLLLALPAVAQDLPLEAAEEIVAAAKKKAVELNTRMDIAVVDAGGNLKAFARMDGAWLGSIDISIRKARTARWFDMNTGEIGKLSQPGGPLFGIEHSNGGLITFPGGVPLRNRKGEIVGAIGVSGSTVENDHTVAVAGAEALGK
ncbi:MAG: heme-binding protein [Acidobacteria bacterium]|nr:heme-binding protein [Acidobacteriota bacterium]